MVKCRKPIAFLFALIFACSFMFGTSINVMASEAPDSSIVVGETETETPYEDIIDGDESGNMEEAPAEPADPEVEDPPSEAEDEGQEEAAPEDILVLRDGMVEMSNMEFRLTDGVYVQKIDGTPSDYYYIEVSDTGGFDIDLAGEYLVQYKATNTETGVELTGTRIIMVIDTMYKGTSGVRLFSSSYNIRLQVSSVYTYNGLCELPGAHVFQMDTAWASYVLEQTGERAYCVESGVYDESAGSLIPYSEVSGGAVWDALSYGQKSLIVTLQYYGRLNNDIGDEAVTIAVQTLIWEVANGYVRWDNRIYHEDAYPSSTFMTHEGANSYWSNARSPYMALIVGNGIEGTYNSIVEQIRLH